MTMAVMSYLACLAIGALILVDRAVDAWTGGLSREMTVQVRQVRTADITGEVEKARRILEDYPGVVEVQVLSDSESAKLLEPWLGVRALEGLPVPRLIRVVTDKGKSFDAAALADRLSGVQGVYLDTHQKWEVELTRMGRALSVLSSLILVLISLSAVAIVIFATRAVLQANKPVVDLLHLVGAYDRYIARQIDGRFVRTGLVAGFMGVAMGLLTFLGLSLTGVGGGGGFASASGTLLFAPPAIAVWSYAALFSVPVAATVICLVTSRLTLLRLLGSVL
ncbi:MAG: hypothetical protein KDK75_03090 [Alphaproteobacteria bacterium]|nr:hypothetical protein [Alphaproteobacteria bacterium]